MLGTATFVPTPLLTIILTVARLTSILVDNVPNAPEGLHQSRASASIVRQLVVSLSQKQDPVLTALSNTHYSVADALKKYPSALNTHLLAPARIVKLNTSQSKDFVLQRDLSKMPAGILGSRILKANVLQMGVNHNMTLVANDVYQDIYCFLMGPVKKGLSEDAKDMLQMDFARFAKNHISNNYLGSVYQWAALNSTPMVIALNVIPASDFNWPTMVLAGFLIAWFSMKNNAQLVKKALLKQLEDVKKKTLKRCALHVQETFISQKLVSASLSSQVVHLTTDLNAQHAS